VTEHQSWAEADWLPEGEPVDGLTLRADGWAYWFSDDYELTEFKTIAMVLGEPDVDFRTLIYSARVRDGKTLYHGQFVISPPAWARLQAYLNQKGKPT
jgi:hypothetical protein